MITKNGSLVFMRARIGNTAISESTLIKTDGTAYASSFSASTVYVNVAGVNNTANTGTSGQNYVVMNLGVGETEPAITDYALANMLVGGADVNTIVKCTGAQIGFTPAGNIVYTYLFTNTSSQAVTIKEIGLFWLPHDYGKFLLGREVLSEPKVIAPNETVTFSYEIAFN